MDPPCLLIIVFFFVKCENVQCYNEFKREQRGFDGGVLGEFDEVRDATPVSPRLACIGPLAHRNRYLLWGYRWTFSVTPVLERRCSWKSRVPID